VERILLEREGDEIARATSLVRYAPGAAFAEHEHGRGEELLVLAGEFRDEHGNYPAGSYLRNPWGSRHAPFSPQGCVLFVKLRQIPAGDPGRVFVPGAVGRCMALPWGTNELLLHETSVERVSLVRWPAGYRGPRHAHPDGEELLVLAGTFEDEQGTYSAGTWLRQPSGSTHQPRSDEGCVLFCKRGPR
jgi:anti-sigma factor ChrR (cupin superfamily)